MRRRVLSQDAGDLRQVAARLAEEGVEEHVPHEEGAVLADPGLLVVALGEELDEPGEPIVRGAYWAIFGGDEVRIRPLVDRYLVWPEMQPQHSLVPHRGVIHPRFPGVADVDQSLPL